MNPTPPPPVAPAPPPPVNSAPPPPVDPAPPTPAEPMEQAPGGREREGDTRGHTPQEMDVGEMTRAFKRKLVLEEEDIDERDREKPAFCAEYAKDIYQHLGRLEVSRWDRQTGYSSISISSAPPPAGAPVAEGVGSCQLMVIKLNGLTVEVSYSPLQSKGIQL